MFPDVTCNIQALIGNQRAVFFIKAPADTKDLTIILNIPHIWRSHF